MLASCLAAFFFALNATCASRSVQASGPVQANLGRLIVAVGLLGLFAHTLGQGFASASTGWFLLSGVIGMGFGASLEEIAARRSRCGRWCGGTYAGLIVIWQ